MSAGSDQLAGLIGLRPGVTCVGELCLEVECGDARGNLLVPTRADDRLLALAQRVVGAITGEDPLDVTLADPPGRLELASDPGPVVDLLGCAAAVDGAEGLGGVEEVAVHPGGHRAAHGLIVAICYAKSSPAGWRGRQVRRACCRTPRCGRCRGRSR